LYECYNIQVGVDESTALTMTVGASGIWTFHK